MTPEIEAAAADWLARRDAGLDANGTSELLHWLAADARHAVAFRDLELLWRTFDAPRLRGEAPQLIQQLGARQRRRRNRVISVVTASATLAAAAAWVLVVRPGGMESGGAAMRIARGSALVERPERRVLDDGSVVELNRGAKFDVSYTASRRDVRLLSGEACFTVTKDPARPFVVATPGTAVRAVGTVFMVSVQPRSMDLLVTEGKVAVDAADPIHAAPRALVAAGNRCSVASDADAAVPLTTEAMSADEMERRLSWRAPRLNLSGTPLSEVAAAFNRENAVQLSIADRSLAELQLTGVFRADRVEDFVRLLEAHYGVRAVRRGPRDIALHRS